MSNTTTTTTAEPTPPPPLAYYWSKTTLCFYPEALQATYATANTWPADAVLVTAAAFATYGLAQAPMGQRRAAGSDGMPAWAATTGP